MMTQRSTWYEVWSKRGYCKLADPYDRFNNQREAKSAIKESVKRQKELGYTPTEWLLMIVDMITTIDDDGVIISQMTTTARA